MTRFILAWLFEKAGKKAESESALKELSTSSYDYFFPSRIQEQLVLEWAIQQNEAVSLAAYGLGNYYFNLKRHEDAIRSWEKAASAGCRYGTLYRNLGIATPMATAKRRERLSKKQ